MPTKIDWTDESINPVIGCTKITAGCANCYAEKMAKRLAAMGIPRYQGVTTGLGWTGEVRYYPQALKALDKLKSGTRVFVGSMADIFHPQLHESNRTDLLERLACYPHLTLQFLTKRPDVMAAAMNRIADRHAGHVLPDNWWLGVSISTAADADAMLPHLRSIIGARVYFASYEPALETIDWEPWLVETRQHRRTLDWLICGAETGPHRRRAPVCSAGFAAFQCLQYNVPFFFKKDSDGATTLNGITYHEFPPS
jgi:protein gp37